MLSKLKDDILRLLKEDEEFRYAVIGLLGLQRLEEAVIRLIDMQAKVESRLARVEEEQISIKTRMDRLEEVVVKLVNIQASMESRLTKVEDTLTRLVDIQVRQEERLSKLEEAWIRSEERLSKVEERLVRVEERLVNVEERLIKVEERLLRVEERLEEHDRKFNAILEELSIHRAKLEEHDRKFNEIMEELRDLRRISNEHTRILEEHTRILQKYDERLRNIESYIEKTSITLEEEAREVIAYRLREKDIVMSIGNLILPDIEIDIYATDTNICIIGEAKTRVSANLIEEIDKDIEKLCRKYPNYLKDKVIKVVYGMQILPNAVDEARKRGIWLVTANKEYTELVIR